MDLLLPSIIISIATGLTLVALFSVITRHETLQPGMVDSFGSVRSTDPSSDTISNEQAMIRTKINAGRAWQLKTLTNLSDVTDLLDQLEMHGIQQREVVALDDQTFAVRWR